MGAGQLGEGAMRCWLWECSEYQGEAPALSGFPLVVSELHSDWSFGRSGHSILTVSQAFIYIDKHIIGNI